MCFGGNRMVKCNADQVARLARRRMQEIQRMTSSARKSQQTRKYQALIGIAEEAVSNARGVLKHKRAKGRAESELTWAHCMRELGLLP